MEQDIAASKLNQEQEVDWAAYGNLRSVLNLNIPSKIKTQIQLMYTPNGNIQNEDLEGNKEDDKQIVSPRSRTKIIGNIIKR